MNSSLPALIITFAALFSFSPCAATEVSQVANSDALSQPLTLEGSISNPTLRPRMERWLTTNDICKKYNHCHLSVDEERHYVQVCNWLTKLGDSDGKRVDLAKLRAIGKLNSELVSDARLEGLLKVEPKVVEDRALTPALQIRRTSEHQQIRESLKQRSDNQ